MDQLNGLLFNPQRDNSEGGDNPALQLRRKVMEQRNEIEQLKKKIQNFHYEKDELTSAKDNLDGDIVDLQSQVTDHQDTCSKLKETLIIKNEQIHSMREKITKLETMVRLIGEDDQKDKIIKHLLERLNTYSSIIRNFRETPM